MEDVLIIKKIHPKKLSVEVAFIFDKLDVGKRARSHTVFIKPNIFCRESSDTGATTDLELLGVVIDYFVKRGNKVLVGEAGANQFAQMQMFVELGIDRFCKKHKAEFLNLNICPSKAIKLRIKGKQHNFKAPVPLLKSNFFVDLPKFKTHLSTRVSWAIKNLYGLLPDKEKWMGHQLGIHETLLALSQRFPADVVLMDGIIAMKGLGPTMGIPERKNLLFGAKDQFVHDVGLLRLLNIKHVPHIEDCGELDVKYMFLNEDSAEVDFHSLGVELRLPPILFSKFFCMTNQLFFTLAPTLDKFMNPKDILNIMVHPMFVGLMRRVQRFMRI